MASQNYPRVTNSYESIATVTVGSGGQSSIDFNSIPSTFKHLQIRAIGRLTVASAGGSNMGVRFNSDTGSNYTYHILSGDGATASAGGGGNTNQIFFADLIIRDASTANVYSGFVIDTLDYADTNKFKTVRGLAGWDANGSGKIALSSGVWRSTSAITSITLVPESNNFKEYSSFALYGIKG
jgi:hypothetical protein